VFCGKKTRLTCIARYIYTLNASKKKWTTFAVKLIGNQYVKKKYFTLDIFHNDKATIQITRWNSFRNSHNKVAKFKVKLNAGKNTLALTKTFQPGYYLVEKGFTSKTVALFTKKGQQDQNYRTYYFPVQLSNLHQWSLTVEFRLNYQIKLLHEKGTKSLFAQNDIYRIKSGKDCKPDPLAKRCVVSVKEKPVLTKKITTYTQVINPESTRGVLLLFSHGRLKVKKINPGVWTSY
jgi:hypothetical protein